MTADVDTSTVGFRGCEEEEKEEELAALKIDAGYRQLPTYRGCMKLSAVTPFR